MPVDQDPRVEEYHNGGTDGVLQGLNTLTPDDLARMKEILDHTPITDSSQDPTKSPHTVEYMNIVRRLLVNNAMSLYDSGTSSGLTRDRLYKIYDEMDESTAYVTAALDILSDDATQPDDEGHLIYIETENEKVRNVIESLFDELEIESKLSKWARAIAKYGDLFIRVYGTSDETSPQRGVSSIEDTIYPSRVSRRDFRGKLIAFVDDTDQSLSDTRYRPPWEYIHFRHKGELTPRSSRDNLSGNDQSSFDTSYGQSVLRAAVKVYTQLRFVENMILLSRLTNSVRRNIFAINVGEVDPSSAFETIKTYADLLKKDINLDLDENILQSQKHSAQYDEDIFIPVSDPKNDFTVQSIGGDVNIAEQYDLDYLQNKLFAALKIPKAYLNYEQDLNARSTLIQLDIRYARSVSQLQNTLISGLKRLVDIHFAYLGMDPDMIDYDITLTGVSAIDQESRLEQKNQRVSAARDFWDVVVSINDTLAGSVVDIPEVGTDFSTGGGGGTGPTDTSGDEDLGSALDDLRSDEENIEVPGEEPSVESESKKIILKESSTNKYNSPLDLEYLAQKVFSEYLDFSEDEVQKILRQTPELSESAKRSKRLRSSLSHNHSVDYTPTTSGRRLYESTLATYKGILSQAESLLDEDNCDETKQP